MNPMPELSPMLKQLRLSGILDSLEARNREAIENKLAYPEFLALLVGAAPTSAPTRRSRTSTLTSTPRSTAP